VRKFPLVILRAKGPKNLKTRSFASPYRASLRMTK